MDEKSPIRKHLHTAARGVHKFIHSLNAYAGLMNVILGIIGALFLVNEWQDRQEDARIKAIEALSGSTAQSRAALAYLTRISANLSHQDLSGVNVSGLVMTDAGLSDARFDNSNLINATLSGDLAAVSLRCADISNLSLENKGEQRLIDARGARISMEGAGIVKWKGAALYTSADVLERLGKNIGKGMKGEIATANFLSKQPGAMPDGSLPYCLYDRLKGQGASHDSLCRGGMEWDGISCE